MAFENFIPEIWTETIARELERAHVFVADTNREYEGEVKQKGDTVKILQLAAPTVHTVGRKAFTGVGTPEVPDDNSALLVIDQMLWYNYGINDIDKHLAAVNPMDDLAKETAEMMADAQDAYVASLAFDSNAKMLDSTATQLSSSNICQKLLEAREKLAENDVSRKTEVVATLPPWAITMYKEAMGLGRATNLGDELVKKGIVDFFDGMTIKESNNVAHKTISTHDVYGIQVKTKRAIAFAAPYQHAEAYRPETQFQDAIKGNLLYGAKLHRSKEMIVLNGYK